MSISLSISPLEVGSFPIGELIAATIPNRVTHVAFNPLTLRDMEVDGA